MKIKCLALMLISGVLFVSNSSAQWSTSGSDIYYNSGNVGIGTSTPSKPLHVVGNSLFSGTISSPGADQYSEKFGGNTSVTGSYSLAVGYNASARGSSVAIGGDAVAGNVSGADYNAVLGYSARTYGSHSISIGHGANTALNTVYSCAFGFGATVTHSGSMVIGANSFSTRNNQVVIGSHTTGYQVSEMVVGMGAKSAYANLYGGVVIKTTDGDGTNVNGSDLKIKAGSGTGSGTGGFISFSTTAPGSSGSAVNTDVESMRITPQANIGIGTTAPNSNAKLHVAGNIYCNNKIYIGAPDANTATKITNYSLAVNGTAMFAKAKVKLYGTWPDYVFDPSYELTDLHVLESFLLKNKHLPSVPAAAEIEKNGIDLGETQAILLKKVEELTLYIIDLNKRIEQLELQNNKLLKTNQ